MILNAFAIYDSKALAYAAPFFMGSTGAAVRAFSDLSNDPQTTIFRHPSDYVLYQVGFYDDSNGLLSSITPYNNLGIGADFVKVNPMSVERPSLVNAVTNGS